METYISTSLGEEPGQYRAISHASPHATRAKTLSLDAIMELGKEVELLNKVTHFFVQVVRHYHRSEENGASEENIMLANATLMKALGRTLWKVADVLLSLKRTRRANADKGISPPVVLGSEPERSNAIEKVMKDLLYTRVIAIWDLLENAGVFQGGEAQLEPLQKPQKAGSIESQGGAAEAISHKGSKETATTVNINNRTGDVECQQTAKEVCGRIGLQGDGIGQEVAA